MCKYEDVRIVMETDFLQNAVNVQVYKLLMLKQKMCKC